MVDLNEEPKCWICQDVADSREHMVKKSDLKQTFGPITQSAPVYGHYHHKKNVPIKGADSRKVKFSHSICKRCNNEKTQPHDQAWEALSFYLQNQQPRIQTGMRIPLEEVFGGEVLAKMANVQLYFVKQLGCQAVEFDNDRLPISTFAASILGNYPLPSVFVSFFDLARMRRIDQISVGETKTLEFNGRFDSAAWTYTIRDYCALIYYTAVKKKTLCQKTYWWPGGNWHGLWMR